MNTRLDSTAPSDLINQPVKPTRLSNLARRIVLSRLEKLRDGQLVIIDDGENTSFGCVSEDFPAPVHLRVNNPQFYSDIAFGGAIAAGETYMHGYWSCSNLRDMLHILLRNRDVLEQVDAGLAILSWPLRKIFHLFNKNTRKGSRKNISAHYDIGNDFFQLWLDPMMMYSCAYFTAADSTLEDAATAKLDRICQKLDLSCDDSVIEIGTGWGGFAIHAAKHYGCHITTTTISQEQFEFAQQAVERAGLEDKVTLLLQDYRDLSGSFDKVVSIEMIEAVGHEYHDDYFKKCCELLKPDGQMLLQAITIADQRYDEYKTGVDFIKRYIFPGGCLTSVTDMARTMTKHTDLRIIDLEDIGPHYATTLRYWHDRFIARLDDVRRLGYSETFIRLWQYYLCYCEIAFIERATGTVHMLMMRPGARRERVRC